MTAKLNRRRFMQTAAASTAALAAPSTHSANRPNIIVIVTDDQRWDMLGCMGNPIIQTPALDRLAQRGALFSNNFCTTSICMSSRATILTGLHERSHAIDSFQKPLSDEQFAWTYPALLREAGYYTGFIGKWGLGGELPKEKFDFFNGFSGQGKYEHVIDGQERHLTSMIADDAVEFLGQTPGDAPFCLAISTKAPHVLDGQPNPFRSDPALDDLYMDDEIPLPKTATQEHFDAMPGFLKSPTTEGVKRWQRRFSTPELYQENVKDYYRLITGVDRMVGRVAAALEENGQARNTVILFTSDNGFFLGERLLAGKWLMYEESIRTPLLIYDPRKPQRQLIEPMSLSIDVMPTILDYAGVEIPSFVQGRSLKTLIDSPYEPWRSEWFYEHSYSHQDRIAYTMGVRANRWKYTDYVGEDYEELFDLRNDPHEEQNLIDWPSRIEEADMLRASMERWIDALNGWKLDPDYRWRDPV